MTTIDLLKEIHTRAFNDPEFYARLEKGIALSKTIMKEQFLENRPDLIRQISVGVGLLMADKSIEEVMDGSNENNT